MKKYIYIYETPSSKLESLIKIGDANDVDKRIKEQLNNASTFHEDGLEYTLLYKTEAVKNDGTPFRDHDIFPILEYKGYPRLKISKDNEILKNVTEWFRVDVEKVKHLISQFKQGKDKEQIEIERFQSFPMRPEQIQAVDKSQEFLTQNFKSGETLEILWNAKMRFGKTFTAYQLARRMGWNKVLVLTYKPAVEDAWQKDLENHVDFENYIFLRRDTLSKIDYYLNSDKKIVAFASYQDLLGQSVDGGIKERHEELFNTHWDVVIIDEFHYGAGTKKAKDMLAEQIAIENDNEPTARQLEQAKQEFFAEEDDKLAEEKETEAIVDVLEKRIASDVRLYLSGTPFKAIANSQFPQEAIYNWTYTDEQKAKEAWAVENPANPELNPYRMLPQIKMYLYKVSKDIIEAGVDEGKDEFSLNYFFKAKNKKFLNEAAVKKWLDLISGVIKPHVQLDEDIWEETRLQPSQYPFDHDNELCRELDHTLWYLNRVDSAYALKQLLENHPVFQRYHIILAAGKELKSGVDAVKPVLDAIDANKRTITISVGKLTTGVSVPKWKGVMFLRDIASPENYFQTAFRAQTPFTDPETGKIKSVCYVFDFSPNRSLRLLTTYSEKLSTDAHLTTSEEKLGEFIKYLPVLKIAGNTMVSMEAREVMTFDLSGIDAKGLGERFIERRNVVVDRETINAINKDEYTQQKVKDIFERIKMFKKFNGASDNEMKNSDVDIANLDVNNNKIKQLNTKDGPLDKKEKKELDKAEKELKSEREKTRELLRTLLSRLPIYMYLTDATEENLEQVLIDDKWDLFRKTTGITVDDFRYLVEIGLLRIESIDGYILKFVNLESQNYEINNRLIQ